MKLEVSGLKRSFGDFSVSLDLSVDKGETLALVGPSGSGKTSALNLITGITAPEAGKVYSGGEDISDLPSWKRNISVVFQDLALFPHFDVGANVAYGLFTRKVTRKERSRIVNETLELVRLPGYASRRIHTLSGGERQRVAIARALAVSPRALLLDEPFSSLDAPLRKDLRREFLEIRSHSEAPCIFVTHDREEAMMLGDRIAVMSNGSIIESGTGRELFLSPKTEFTARFFGAGQVLPCTILEKRDSGALVSSPLGNLLVPQGSEYSSSSPMVFIPHDAIHLEETPGLTGIKVFKAVFLGAVFEGQRTVLKVQPNQAGTAKGLSFDKTVEALPLEVIAGPRIDLPTLNSTLTLWVDQSLVSFVSQVHGL